MRQNLLARCTSPAGLILVLLSAGPALVSCTDERAPAPFLDIAAGDAATQANEDEFLRKQQMVLVQFLNVDGTEGEPVEQEVSIIESYASNYCTPFLPSSMPPCELEFKRDVLWPLCTARVLLSAATAQAQPIEIVYSGGGLRVFPPSEAAAANLATRSLVSARPSVSKAIQVLATPALHCRNQNGNAAPPYSGGILWVPDANGSTYAGAYASSLLDGYYLSRAAYDRATEATLNASDQLRSSSVSPRRALERAISGPVLSRAAAAHLLVDGDPGLLGSTTQPLCTQPELAPQGRTALQLLRDSGIAPAVLRSTTTTADILNGSISPGTVSGDPKAAGSVRERLAQFYAYDSLAGGTAVQALYDLSVGDFDAARAYLVEEVSAFGRSTSAQHPAEHAGAYRRYTATATEPTTLPSVAWAARARQAVDRFGWPAVPIASTGSVMGLDRFIASTHTAVSNILRRTDNFAAPGEDAVVSRQSVAGGLSSILTSKEYVGLVEVDVLSSSVLIGVHGFNTSDRVRAVIGEDGLRCAVDGSIEGAPCVAAPMAPTAYPCPATVDPNLECLTALRLSATDSIDQTQFGVGVGVIASSALDWDGLVNSRQRVYIVRPRTAESPELPGHYEALTGFVAAPGVNYYPIVPTVAARVGEVLAPSKKYCAAAEVSCVGAPIDARLPLEDELTDDHDGVESSWKHYLALARQAAEEADLLGREFRETRLAGAAQATAVETLKEEQTQRAEEALREVQAMCGTAIDSRRLLTLLSTPNSGQCTTSLQCGYLKNCVNGACVSALPNLGLTEENKNCPAEACGEGYVCTAGRCVADLGAVAARFPDDADLQRLARCLDDSPTASVPFVTLGDAHLCVAVDAQDSNDICPESAVSCPVERGNSCPEDTSAVSWLTAEPLGYFANPGPPELPGRPCDALRQLRKIPGRQDAVQALRRSDVLHPTRMRDAVGKIGWRSSHGSYSSITVDGVEKISTGAINRALRVTWPCAHSAYGNCSDQQGLYCTFENCAVAGDRARMNARLFRAAFAAHVIIAEDVTRATDFQDRLHHDDPLRARWLLPFATAGLSNVSNWTTLYDAKEGNQNFPILVSEGEMPLINGVLTTVTARAQNSEYRSTPAPVSWLNEDLSSLIANGNAPLTQIWLEVGSSVPLNIRRHEKYFFGGLSSLPVREDGEAWAQGVLVDGRSLNEVKAKFVPYAGIVSTPVLQPAQGQTTAALSGGDLLDGMELLCELSTEHANLAAERPMTMETLDDIESAGWYVRKLAQDIEGQAASMVFANIPRIAFESMQESSATGVFPALSADMAAEVSSLRAGMRSMRRVLPDIAAALNMLGAEMRVIRSVVEANEIKKELIDLKTLSTTLDRATQCADSVFGFSAALDNIVTLGTRSAVDCANAFAQIAIAFVVQDRERDLVDLDSVIAKAGFTGRMAQIARNLQQSAIDLEDGADQVRQSLAVIDGLRQRARLSLARAIYLSSAQSQKQVEYIKTLGTLAVATQLRYQRALNNAKQMAFFAKRAIELRLGVRLSEIRESLPLVDAPASWEGTVCTMTGIDEQAYQSLATGRGYAKYADGFIGDYVTKLENLVESYRLQFRFHEGQDIAVVSLRDDVMNVRARCRVEGQNLLLDAAELDRSAKWRPLGCNPVTIGGVVYPARNCIAAVATGEAAITTLDTELSAAMGYRLQFGDGRGCPAATGLVGPCGWQSGATLAQAVALTPGHYRLSWYTKEPLDSGGARVASLRLLPTAGLPAPMVDNATFEVHAGVQSNDWNRALVEFTVEAEGTYEIGFGVSDATLPAYAVTLAAPMLESIPSVGAEMQLPSFQNTGADGTTPLHVCEDTDGAVFRAKHWRSDCVRVCNGGFSNNCSDGTVHCYRELSFGISQGWLQNGKLFNFSGFARGNYNYRIDSLAVNFVGTGARACEESALPNTCYNAGFVPYTIEHNGPFYVRNHAGDDYRAFLFDGRIEHARGLASERYLTNPLSPTDRELLTDYMRPELRGRPLDGNFVVRVWEEPGVDFDAIQDVQLLLHYRYWTRFE